VDRYWLVVVRDRRTDRKQTTWIWPTIGEEVSRPMNNCLRPMGIPYATYRRDLGTAKARLQHLKAIPHCERDPMPAWPGDLIETVKGVRRLLNDELAKGQGMPNTWTRDQYPPSDLVRRTPAVHILEFLSEGLTNPPLETEDTQPDESDDAAPGLIPR
jgi:hypothetical protein